MMAAHANDPTARPARARRVLAYCHDSVGLGHLRRTSAIIERVGRSHPDSCFLVATGTPYISLFDRQERGDYLKLPALTKGSNGRYRAKYLSLSLKEIVGCREALLLETVKHYAPDVLLVDKAPLGVCRELLPTLRWLRQHRPHVRTIFGMRDIEDAPLATISQWTDVQPMLASCYDEIWVYGMRTLFDVAEKYRLSAAVRQKLRYMGYVARPACPHEPQSDGSRKPVLVTVGGGTDGERVLHCYLAAAAARVAEMGGRSVMIGGPDLPEKARKRLRAAAEALPHVDWHDVEACMSCRIRAARLVVTMGGYNTLCELAVQRQPALVIPRTTPRLEQRLRAELWEQLGVVRMFPDPELDPEHLADAVADAFGAEFGVNSDALDLDGLERVAQRFDEMHRLESDDALAVRL
jgi:predicted glycosyltransferase